ncbi:MAG: hypothetical protein H6710_02935 [Myxococcales bacterium]|nr:hypothetical protein [Myxococcales bacterium]
MKTRGRGRPRAPPPLRRGLRRLSAPAPRGAAALARPRGRHLRERRPRGRPPGLGRVRRRDRRAPRRPGRPLAAEARAKGEAGEALAPELRRLGRLDPGLVHSADLHRLRARRWELEAPIRIAVLHHPVSPLPTITDVAPYAGLINAGAVKDALFDRRFALVLHGHQHAQWLGEERWPGHAAGDHTLRIAAAPSLGSREVAEQHGYNEVLILREGDRHEVEVRTYTRSGDTWSRGPASLGPFAVE